MNDNRSEALSIAHALIRQHRRRHWWWYLLPRWRRRRYDVGWLTLYLDRVEFGCRICTFGGAIAVETERSGSSGSTP